ncbi:vitellogenin-like [Penaeus japonicus]|uniref:vitellogenin-like n=1 Tax=Penaeus japonicus TaxID=27405 RepID=UPI001C713EF7|nr:vitellogenin-like [Penaeus japonicus]
MTTSSLLFVLALVAGGLAAPWGADLPRCSTECPISGSPKLAYQPEKTYTYQYSGKSRVQLKGVDDGVSETEWAARVDLTWISPCDVAISFNNMKMDGARGPIAARTLERHPLVVAVVDGRVQHVCAHPDDEPWAINLKKGVASAFQNSIPSLSTVSSGMTVTETDVVGKCPTTYQIETEGEKVIVVKEKNHRHCQQRYPTPAETPAPWLKAPLPIEESKSECKQEITNGIYTSIMCHDKNIVRPAIGIYKYVEANQESTLHFISETTDTSAITAIPRGEMHIGSLLYNHETMKDPELAPELDQLMKEICEKTKDTVEAEAAALVAKALHLLRRVPETVVVEIAQKVRQGHYCSDSAKLESIFLDAVAFLHESGAVKVMVQEILNGRATGGRLALYTAALYLTPRPNIEAVKALTPLFESPRPMPSLLLAAASMVNHYCRHTPHCHQEAPVERIAEILAAKVEGHCSPSIGVEEKEEALAIFKALGNMGVVTPAVTRAAAQCIEKEGLETSIRVAAAQAFRQANCDRPAVQKLVDIATRPTFETEVRIASYLAAIRCAEKEHLEQIIEKISKEENTQVRGFVLGHLINIQESTCPTKENLKYLLTNVVIPTDFEKDFRKFSRNVEMSYHAPAFGMGADLESNIIYAPGSFIPRAVNLNMKAAVDETHMDLAEIGARFEGIDSIIEELFGPEGYLRKATFGKIMQDITGFAEEKGLKVMEHIKQTLRTKRSIDSSVISDFFGKLYGEGRSHTHAEVFARIMGHEITYADVAESLKGVTADTLIETFFSFFEESLEQMKGLNLNTARTAQLYMDYSLPTIQGTPLKLKLAGTAVAGLKMEGDFNIAQILSDPGNLQTGIKLFPALSVQATGFVGFECRLTRVGIEMENTISSATGASINIRTTENKKIQMELEIPEKMELLNIKAETYLVKAVGKKLTKITPPTIRDVRVTHAACLNAVEPVLGIKVCYNINMPDVFRANGLPLGEPAIAKLYIEKADPSMRGYLMTAAIKNKKGNKFIKLNVEAAGATTPRRAEMTLSYTKEEGSHIVSAKLDSSSIAAGVWTTLTNEEGHKAMETYVKFDYGQIAISRGIKLDMIVKEESAGKEFEVNVFSGRSRRFTPESHIVEAKFIKKTNGPEVNVDVICRTRNALAQYFDLNIEVGADFMEFSPEGVYPARYIPKVSILLPVALRKMEVHANTVAWKLASYIREGSQSGESRELISAFKLSKGRNDIIYVQATHKIEGTLPQNIVIENEATVEVGRSSYRAMYDIFYHPEKMGASVEVFRTAGNEKVAEMEAIYENTGEKYYTKFLVEAPGYIRPVRIEATAEEETGGRYALESAIKYGERTVFEVTGPVMARFNSKTAKLQANIKLSAMASEPYIIGANFVFGNKKQMIAMEIKEREEPVFGVEWKMVRESAEKTTLGIAFVLPALIENKVDAVITEDLVHVSFNNLVLPKTSYRRRVKGFADVNIGEKRANVEFSWDADKSPEKKLVVDASLISSPSNPGHAEIHGNIILAGEPYHIKLDLAAAVLLENSEGENGFKLILTMPTQKTIAMEAFCNVQLEGAATKVISNLHYKNVEEKEYKYTSIVSLEKLGGPVNYAAEAKVLYTAPQVEVQLETAFKHHWTPEEHVVALKVAAEAPLLERPITMTYQMRNGEGSFVGICKMERETPATVFEWDLKITPEGGIESVEAGVDMKAIVEALKVVRAVATFAEEGIGAYRPETAKYRYRFTRPSPTTYVMQMRTPTRTMEGRAKLSPRESGIKFYPNKGKAEAKYEIGYKVNHQGRWGQRGMEVRMNHPVLPKPIMVAAQYTAVEETFKGTIELDIFPGEENKITGTLETQRISENAIRVEVFLTGKIFKVNPKAIVTVAYAPETFALDVVFHKTPSTAPVFALAAKYDKTSAHNAAATFTVEMEQRPVFEITAVAEPEEEVPCNGIRIKAIANAPAFGKYNIFSKMCKPAFIELTTMRHGGEKEYTARLGLRYPDTAEAGVYVASGRAEEIRGVAVAAVKLASPTMLKVEMAYGPEEAQVLMSEVSEDLTEVAMSLKAFVMEVVQFLKEEAAQKGIHFQSSQLVILVGAAREELNAIYRDILSEMRILDSGIIADILESPAVSLVSRVYLGVWSQIARLQRDISTSLVGVIQRCQLEMEDITEVIMETVMAVARILETREVPEPIRVILEYIEDSEAFRIVRREVEAVLEEYPEEYEAIKHVLTKVMATLERDVDIVRERIMESPAVQKIIDYIMHLFNSERVFAVEAERVVSLILNELLFVSIEREGNGIEVQIPLHRPLYSLTQVAQEAVPNPITMLENLIFAYLEYIPIPVEHAIWAYYNFIPRYITDVLPPYPRTAMVVGGSEILTFDGLVVRAPRSPCKVLLAAHGSHRLMMSHPQPSAPPQLELNTPAASVVIKPDFEVLVDGRPLTGSQQTIGNIRIVNAAKHIEVGCPLMKVVVAKTGQVVAVEASGWTYGRVAGLLGPNTGEIADDRLMPTGVQASSPRELVSAWQEDQGCSTPEVPRSETTVARLIQCQTLLGIRSRCNPVVQPQPFINMCHAARNACDAAHAYRTICALRGVEDFFLLTC